MTTLWAARLIVTSLIMGGVLAGVILLGMWADSASWVCTTHEVPTGAVGTAAQGWDVTNTCGWQW